MKMYGLYGLNAEIESLIEKGVDEETGEISEEIFEKLNALAIERNEKLENVALWIKNVAAETKMVKEEEKRFTARRRALENQEARLREYLKDGLQGEKFKTGKVNIYYTHPKSVEIDDAVFFSRSSNGERGFFRISDPEANKEAIKKALEAGETVEGASLVEGTSMVLR